MDKVNWILIEKVFLLDADDMNHLIESLKKSHLRQVDYYTIKRYAAVHNTWCCNWNHESVIVRVVCNMNIKQYMFSINDTGEHRSEITGRAAFDYVETYFKRYNPSMTLFRAFSGISYKARYKAIKNCVPKQISMISNFAKNKRIKKCYKADISSAYPFEGSKLLPTLEKHQFIQGTVKPNKDYPFAFYIRSKHSAVYGEYDTHEWKNFQQYYTLYRNMFWDCDPKEDITILCKASNYSLEETFNEIYQRKLKGDQLAKLGMNAAIGYFQKNTDPKLSHLSAVIIGRCCDRIIKLCKALEEQEQRIIFIATDSIVWKGKESDLATDEKFIGSFTYEYKDCEFYGTGPKAYQIMSNGKTITKYAGMKNGEEKESILFGKLPDGKGCTQYIINEDSGHIITVDF